MWILFGLGGLVNLISNSASYPLTTLIISTFMLGGAGALLIVNWGIRNRKRLLYYPGLAIVAVNGFLSVTDEFGWYDLLALISHSTLLVLLVRNRLQILPTK